jgi:SAM-dependent MidA family methyltransferase
MVPSSIDPLPEPDQEARGRSRELVSKIRRAIDAAGGSIGFHTYMNMALYDPRLGYYHAPRRIFGKGGDFVTAPEVSPLFAHCVARPCARVLKHLGGDILEFGAGSGTLAAELLLTLEKLDALPQRYYILELSAALRQRQAQYVQKRAPELFNRVSWLEALPQPGFKGVILANEVLDAMPMTCFALRENTLFERRATFDQESLIWIEQPADASLRARIEAIIAVLPTPLPDGYRSELNPALSAWMRSLAGPLHQALLLIIDYGYPRSEYYHAQRSCGTLLCHYQHRAHDNPFFYPGLQDISANVDFSAVAEASAAAGFDLLKYTTQAQFLLSSDLDNLFASAANECERWRLAQEVKRLTLPGEMGDRFQVMALGRGIESRQLGFAGRNYLARL